MMAQREIVPWRSLPACEFLCTTSAQPVEARSLLERAFLERADVVLGASRPSRGDERGVELRVRPTRFWSPSPLVTVLFVPSVAGANVHVRLRLQVFWWIVLALMIALFLEAADIALTLCDEVLFCLVDVLPLFLVLFFLVVLAAGTLRLAMRRAAADVTAALPEGTPIRGGR